MVDIDNIGSVEIRRSTRARRISLAIRRDGSIRLTTPNHIDTNQALDFLESKREWVFKTLRRIQSFCPANRLFTPSFTTREHRLCLIGERRSDITTSISRDTITIRYPEELNYDDPTVQSTIKEAVTKVLKQEALTLLPARVEQQASYCRTKAPQYSWRYGKVTIRQARTRWGSCSATNNISLNVALAGLPDHLIDYIIIHELVHTVHKNHRKEFHALLDYLLDGQEKQLREQLHHYRHLLDR